MKINHFSKGELYGSYIYFIFSKELIYIGETQKIAFVRWVNHLYDDGTLMKKINMFGDPSVNYKKNLNFVSINCLTIRHQFNEIRWKTITQAVEHSIHKLLYTSQSILLNSYYSKYEPTINQYKIISDTSRTTPSTIPKSEWDFADEYARRVVAELCSYL